MDATIDKLTRKLYTNSRIELEFFMFLPTIDPGTGSTATLSCNPILNLRYKKSRNLTEEFDFKKASYKITPRNLFSVIKFFNTIITWLYDDKYIDLFLVDENNTLIFNADYNKLSVSTPRGDFDQCIMQAIPAIVKFGDKMMEGVHLYINSTNYCVSLTFQEVAILFSILKDFSFSNEINSSLLAFDFAYRNKRFESQSSKFNKPTPFD